MNKTQEHLVRPSFFEIPQFHLVTAAALLAISALVAGGLLLHFQVGTIPAACLMRGGAALIADLATMNAIRPDIYIAAGDFNVTREHYKTRLDLLETDGYTTDFTDNAPTIFDANLETTDGTPLPVKLDHIYAKGGANIMVRVQSLPLQRTELPDFNNRASDHLPIGATVHYSYVRS